jgi:heme oxygenase (mycobilin-producing)
MFVYLTTGTSSYLKTVKEKHPDEALILMENGDQALLLHETTKPSIFNSPRKLEVIDQRGIYAEKGFVVMNNIPVTDEGRPVFEHRFKNRAGLIEKEPGFIALRVLRPINSDTYVILTMWENESAFNNWKSSSSFKQAHEKKEPAQKAADFNKNIFSGPPFVTQYTIKGKDEDE